MRFRKEKPTFQKHEIIIGIVLLLILIIAAIMLTYPGKFLRMGVLTGDRIWCNLAYAEKDYCDFYVIATNTNITSCDELRSQYNVKTCRQDVIDSIRRNNCRGLTDWC
ncbi:MAG: hypothetical protein ACP5NV_06845 [Candidatus Woesearchaeota archaeon]